MVNDLVKKEKRHDRFPFCQKCGEKGTFIKFVEDICTYPDPNNPSDKSEWNNHLQCRILVFCDTCMKE